MNFKISFVIILFFQAFFNLIYSQENKLVGKIEGRIVDSETQTEIIGANILIIF